MRTMSDQPSRCILVLGTGRSGTSAVGGVLHKLGVDMGETFIPSNRNNRFGTFEDAEFRSLDIMVQYDGWMSDESVSNAYSRIIDRRSEYRLWGVKDPTMVLTLNHVLPLLDDVRFVFCIRDKEDTIQSFIKAYNKTRAEAELWYREIDSEIQKAMTLDIPSMTVDFDDLLAEPEKYVERLSNFAYDGLDISRNGNQLALQHIQPKGPTDREGWGSVCVGVRSYKHPELDFFVSWTDLVVGGLGADDLVLLPEGWLPGHQAATKIAQAFLHSDCDSILFVDDDMVFDQSHLRKLRNNSDNWEYDVVMGYCTKRTWPPMPVIMRSLDDQPEDSAVMGEGFEIVREFEEGLVLPVDAVGLAFTLVRRKVFEAMTDQTWGVNKTDYFRYGPGRQGPDIPFSQDCRRLGFKLAIDTSVEVGHVGRFVMSSAQYRQWLKGQESREVENA